MNLFEAKQYGSLGVDSVLNATKFGSTNIASAFWMATTIFIPCFTLYAMVSGLHSSEPDLAIIHLGSAISLLVFWKSIHWGKGRYDTFGATLLLFYAFFKVHAALDNLFYGSRIDEIYHAVPLPENLTWLFMKSEALNHFGILLLVAVWRRIVGKHLEQFSFLNNFYLVGKALPVFTYVAALVVALLSRIFELNFGVFSQIFSLTYQFGVVSIFFIAAMKRGRYRQIVLALVLAVPMVIMALGTGMKENLFFPLVPAGIITWFRFRSTSLKIVAVILFFILLSYAQLYVQHVRMVSWGGGGSNHTTTQLLEGFQRSLSQGASSDGINSISSRMNMTISRAITVAIADAKGFRPYDIFAPIPASLIPRILWPDKPILQPGARHTLWIHDLNWSDSEAWSATAAGFFTELYLGGGYIGWFLGVVLYAALLGIVQRYSWRIMPGFGHLALSFLTFYWALRFEEKHIVYAFTSIIFTFIFVVLIVKGAAMLSGRRPRFRIV